MTSVTVVVPMIIRRRGGRKQIIGPDGAPVQAGKDISGAEITSGDPALVKALARAFRWRRMLEDGRYGSIRDLATAEGVDRAYVGRLLSLALLAPDITESILEGRQLPSLCAGRARCPLPVDWQEQRANLLSPSSGQITVVGGR